MRPSRALDTKGTHGRRRYLEDRPEDPDGCTSGHARARQRRRLAVGLVAERDGRCRLHRRHRRRQQAGVDGQAHPADAHRGRSHRRRRRRHHRRHRQARIVRRRDLRRHARSSDAQPVATQVDEGDTGVGAAFAPVRFPRREQRGREREDRNGLGDERDDRLGLGSCDPRRCGRSSKLSRIANGPERVPRPSPVVPHQPRCRRTVLDTWDGSPWRLRSVVRLLVSSPWARRREQLRWRQLVTSRPRSPPRSRAPTPTTRPARGHTAPQDTDGSKTPGHDRGLAGRHRLPHEHQDAEAHCPRRRISCGDFAKQHTISLGVMGNNPKVVALHRRRAPARARDHRGDRRRCRGAARVAPASVGQTSRPRAPSALPSAHRATPMRKSPQPRLRMERCA